MKTWLIAAIVAGMAASFVPLDAEAKRFGGGKSSGMQRDMPTRSAPDAPPARPAAPSQAAAAAPAAGAAAAASRPGWLAPVAGLAAGLGLAALATHLGFGEGLANVLMLVLLGVAAFFVVRLLMRSFGGGAARPATAGAGAAGGTVAPRDWPRAEPAQPLQGAAASVAPAAPAVASSAGMQHLLGPSIPADFDREGFERIAKMIFIRMQAAHDSGDLNDLRQFTTPEMFASVRLDLQERGAAANHTDVVRVDAEVLDVAQEGERHVVSVRFHGLIREDEGAEHDFDEVWHLVKADERSSWAIAGIQQHA
ncbi:MAG: Tim44-like domain-containing protein [Burkholderiaceae bacterium]|nr:Tim44-like domain-containing protein [Burkholderiaceae bacterium]